MKRKAIAALAAATLFCLNVNAQTTTNWGERFWTNGFAATGAWVKGSNYFTMPDSWLITNKITIDTSFVIYAGYQGTNWMTVSNSLHFGNVYVVCVTPKQWKKLTNTYPDKVEKMPMQFYRK